MENYDADDAPPVELPPEKLRFDPADGPGVRRENALSTDPDLPRGEEWHRARMAWHAEHGSPTAGAAST
jgi:hypothetical protein